VHFDIIVTIDCEDPYYGRLISENIFRLAFTLTLRVITVMQLTLSVKTILAYNRDSNTHNFL